MKIKITTPSVKTTHVPKITPTVIGRVLGGVVCKLLESVPLSE